MRCLLTTPLNILKPFSIIIGVIILFCLFTQTMVFSQDSLIYLGQEPPGDTPKLFPPDSLLSNNSWFWHGPPIFSPDLHEMHWNKYVKYSATDVRLENYYMKVDNEKWTSPQRPDYADTNYHEKNPFISPNGDMIYFISEGRSEGYIFKSIRTANSWTQPEPVMISVPSGMVWGGQFSVARNGSIYLDFDRPNVDNSFDVYRANRINNQYEQSQTLGPNINTNYNDYMPFIDPDEEYIIFRSNRPGGYGNGDLYISFNKVAGAWTEPVNLGPQVNSDKWEGWPYVSPDKKYLFFISLRTGDVHFNPYWVSADVIENLRISVGVDDENGAFPKEIILLQNYPNPFNPSTKIKYILHKPGNIILKIFNLSGQELETLFNGFQPAGEHEITWHPKELSSGIYFYRLQAGEFSKTKKFILQN